MRYWIFLAKQYMLQHKGRTMYSIFGIVITFVMCFSILTAGSSIWDYAFRLNHGDQSQLWVDVSNVNEESEVQGLTEEMIEQIHVLEQCDEVQSLLITNGTWMDQDYEAGEYTDDEYGTEVFFEKYRCTPDELQVGDDCSLSIQLKDWSNLRQSAESLREKTGLDIRVQEEIEMYLGQGDSTFPAFYRSIEAILASIVALFCIMILRNTMMISVVERMRDYGVYRCVGMSRKQLYIVLAVEGLLMSLVAVVFGVAIGYGLLQAITPWLNHVLRGEVPFRFGLYGSAVLFTALLCIAVTLYALLEPSRQAGQISPIEAIHNNIVLRNRHGKVLEKLRYHQSGIWGKFFGAPGEYAYKNMKRNRGRFAGLFVSLLVCIVMVGVMGSVSSSLKATVVNMYQGKNMEYLESVYPDGIEYDSDLADKIQQEVSQIKSVHKTGILFRTTGLLWDVDPVLREYLEKSTVTVSVHHAYNKEDIQSLKSYLIAGNIDYDAMTRENGVILCDMQYNVESADTDFNQMDVRMTDYQVGDRIARLSPEGRKKTVQIYEDALQYVAQKLGISATEEAGENGAGDIGSATESQDISNLYVDSYTDEDEGFVKCRKEFIRFLKKQGIDFSAQEDEITYIKRFRNLLHEWAVEQGYVDEYVIQGIISENSLTGRSQVRPYIEIIHPMDAIPTEEIVNPQTNYFVENEEMGKWNWYIQVSRDPEVLLDGELEQYCNQQKYCQMHAEFHYEDEEGDFSIESYQEMIHTMQITQMISTLFIICIALICMVQVYNTICSNLTIRKKELWLYEAVGMSRRQELRMLLLEHASATFAAVVVGYLLAWGISWYFISYLLDQDGSIQYTWSGWTVVLSGIFIIVMICLVCMAGIRRSKKYNEQ